MVPVVTSAWLLAPVAPPSPLIRLSSLPDATNTGCCGPARVGRLHRKSRHPQGPPTPLHTHTHCSRSTPRSLVGLLHVSCIALLQHLEHGVCRHGRRQAGTRGCQCRPCTRVTEQRACMHAQVCQCSVRACMHKCVSAVCVQACTSVSVLCVCRHACMRVSVQCVCACTRGCQCMHTGVSVHAHGGVSACTRGCQCMHTGMSEHAHEGVSACNAPG